MVLVAKWLLEHDPEARILVITDRDKLDKQIEVVMKNAGVIGAESPSSRITSRAEFVQKLGTATPRRASCARSSTSSTLPKREAVLHKWHKSLLHEAVPGLIRKWEQKLGVEVAGYFLQRMKTKWGGSNRRARNIRLNTELVKKPKDLLEYVIVHEMAHLVEPTHSGRFVAILEEHYPTWREARAELNELPLAAESWNG